MMPNRWKKVHLSYMIILIALIPVFLLTSCGWNGKFELLQTDNKLHEQNDQWFATAVNKADPRKTAPNISFRYNDPSNLLADDYVDAYGDPEEGTFTLLYRKYVSEMKYIEIFFESEYTEFFQTKTESTKATIYFYPEGDGYDAYFEYLSVITFNVRWYCGAAGGIGGTAWLVKKLASPANTYIFASNLHVLKLLPGTDLTDIYTIPEAAPSGVGQVYMFASGSADDSGKLPESASQFRVQDVQFLTTQFNSMFNGDNGIDMGFFRVTFGSGADASTTNALNQFNNPAGKPWANFVSPGAVRVKASGHTDFTEANPAFIYGYPSVTTPSQDVYFKIENHILYTGKYSATSRKHGILENDEEPPKYRYNDMATQYAFPNQQASKNWMDHGASGSPILNDEYKICGIYWGGFSDEIIFQPYASAISSSNLWGLL